MRGKSRVVGISVGNAEARAAIWEGRAEIVPLEEGERAMPSAVLLHRLREVGKYAYLYSGTDPDLLVSSINRLLGRKYSELAAELARSPFQSCKEEERLRIMGQMGEVYAPIELYAMVLRKLQQATERYVGTMVNKAVIAVPGSFDDFQRRSVRVAAESVFQQVKLINEPTAALLAMREAAKLAPEQQLMTFDLGAGKCEVAIIERTKQGCLRIKAIAGDTHLGGDDIDYLIFQQLATEFQQTYGEPLIGDSAMARHEVLMAIRKAKMELERVHTATITVPFVNFDRGGRPLHLHTTITREQVKDLCHTLWQRALALIAQCRRDAHNPILSKVILLGGSTRLPFIATILEEALGQPPLQAANPDELATMGASIYGAQLAGEIKADKIEDITAHSLGITTYNGDMGFVLKRQQAIPASSTKRFSTVEKDQCEALIEVREGEEYLARANRVIGQFSLPLAPRLPRGSPIDVTIGKDEDGIVLVRAYDPKSGSVREIAITYDL